MAISFYTSEQDGATIVNSPATSSEYTKNRSFTVNDNSSNPNRTQYGYGTAPMTAEAIEAISNRFSPGSGGSINTAVGDNGKNKTYDTTIGETNLSASSNESIDGMGSRFDFTHMMDIIHNELYLPASNFSYKKQLHTLATRYNRFKLPNYDMEIKKGFAHVFFCRPQCNLMDSSGNLLEMIASTGAYGDIYDQNPLLVSEICNNVSHSSDFMYILSNYAKSFSLNDEELHSDTYGRTYTGYKISYGKTNIESKTAGSFSVTFADDRMLSIYKIHRMWTDYINDVYRGKVDPDVYNIVNKILDYVGSVYYFLTADDNETILFWSKYYGVYPTSIPSSQYSWNAGSFVNPENITIQYNYSWKDDFNPTALLEFNANAKIDSYQGGNTFKHAPSFDKNLFHMGAPIVGTPYIERIVSADLEDNMALPYTERAVYKLRFIPDESM